MSYMRFPLGKNQVSGVFHIFMILEHQTAGNLCQRTDGPGVLPGIDGADQILVAGNRVSQPQARSREEI